MFPEERQKKIIGILDEQKSVRVAELSKMLETSEVTIRRDLEELDKQNADQCPSTVKADIFERRCTSCHKRLVVFVKTCKADTDDTGKKKEPESSDTVYIKRKRNCNGKKKIFGHMCSFSYIIVNLICFIKKFIIAFSLAEQLIFCFNDFITDLIT